MSPTGKWIEGIALDADVAEAARIAVRDRLSAVMYWLPPAAYCSEFDVEYVHRLRVSTRRAMAALRLYRNWLPRKPARRVKKWLKQIRKAAGEARDLDVLRIRIEEQESAETAHALQATVSRRAQVQPRIIRVADRARRRRRLQRQTKRLIDGIESCCNKRCCDECAPFQKWAQHRLNELATEFFESMPSANDDPAALHQFRIRAKALRYAIEVMSPAFGPELRHQLYPIVEELQERLGRINDHAAALARLDEWSKEGTNEAKRNELRSQAEAESRRLDDALHDFHSWWVPTRIESFRSGLLSTKSLAVESDR
jgi:CHAD domain-containing protein